MLVNVLSFIFEYWFITLWVICIVAAYIIGGWRIAVIVATLGATASAFKLGKKIEKDNIKKKVEIIEKKREEAYETIKNRNTNRSDVIDRLRKRSY